MNRCTLIALAGLAAAPCLAQPQIGVSIDIARPGVYGRIDIGSFPPPPVVYVQPVLIAPPRVLVRQAPLYLYVPPGHQKNWAKHCGRYNACGQPVYFVQERWVQERYDERHRDDDHERKGKKEKKEKKGKGKHGDD